MGDIGPTVLLLLIVLAVILLVCWIVLPFAVIGTKPLLRELLREQRRTNELLDRLSASRRQAQIAAAAAAQPPTAQPAASRPPQT